MSAGPSEPDETALPTSSSTPEDNPLLTNDRRRAMHAALSEKDAELGALSRSLASKYLGALHAHSQKVNPENLAQAAHSLRELIDDLPVVFEAPAVDYESLLPRVRRLLKTWERIAAEGRNNAGQNRERFESEMAQFAEVFTAVRVTRRAQAGEIITRMDVSQRDLPAEVQDLRISELGLYREYFLKVCHHGTTTPKKFEQMLESFERFVLDYRQPTTYEDATTLKRIVREAEGNA